MSDSDWWNERFKVRELNVAFNMVLKLQFQHMQTQPLIISLCKEKKVINITMNLCGMEDMQIVFHLMKLLKL